MHPGGVVSLPCNESHPRRCLCVCERERETEREVVVAVPEAVRVAMDVHGGTPAKRRVLVVADPGRESGGALDWALSHAVLEHDELILLHVEPPSSRRGGSGGGTTLSSFLRRSPPPAPTAGSLSHIDSGGCGGGGCEYEFLEGMRAACEKKQPKVTVQIERVEMEGKDKAAAILMQSKLFAADLLVIGQRRNSSTSFLGCRLSGSSSKGSGKATDVAEFLIENSKCLCVGVQKKGQNMGYLLNTKSHKNFWLLA